MDQYDWVLFTSVNGVKFFLQQNERKKIDIRQLGRAKIAVVGPKTKEAVEAYGLIVECMPQEHVAEAWSKPCVRRLQKGEKILLPRSNIARNLLPIEVKKMGCQVDAVDAYDTVLEDKHARGDHTRVATGLCPHGHVHKPINSTEFSSVACRGDKFLGRMDDECEDCLHWSHYC